MEELKKSSQGEDGEEAGDKPIIFGTYIDKDQSLPAPNTDGVRKMLKVSYD